MTQMGQLPTDRGRSRQAVGASKADRGRAPYSGDSLAKVIPNHERVHPVRLQLSSRQADAPLLHLQFAIIIAPGNLRPCRGQSYVPVFGLLLPNRTSMVCI